MCGLVGAKDPWFPAVYNGDAIRLVKQIALTLHFITKRIIMPQYYLNLCVMIHNHSLLYNTNIYKK